MAPSDLLHASFVVIFVDLNCLVSLVGLLFFVAEFFSWFLFSIMFSFQFLFSRCLYPKEIFFSSKNMFPTSTMFLAIQYSKQIQHKKNKIRRTINKQIQMDSLLKLIYYVCLIVAYLGVISAWDKFWRMINKQFYAFQLGESNHFFFTDDNLRENQPVEPIYVGGSTKKMKS